MIELPPPTGEDHNVALARIAALELKVAVLDDAMAAAVTALEQVHKILDRLVP